MLINPGETVAIEDPAYSGAKAVFKAQGGIMAPIRVDKHGFAPKAWLPTRNRLAFAYCTPSHQFPTGAKMPVQRRLELLQWAREQDTYIIEDDYDSEFRYEGSAIEAVHALDSDNRVIYIGSFSKHLFPALRLGFIVAPPMLIKPLYATKYLADRHTALLSQLVLHEFIEEGHFERHLRRMRMQNAVKRDHLLKTVREMLGSEVTVTGAHSGVHICVWFTQIPCHLAKTFDKYLQKNNIELKFIADLSELPAQSVAVLLGYETLSEQEITIGITELARLYKQFITKH
jgi:GntR family transcriptional regulator/MocR family aminotransferase